MTKSEAEVLADMLAKEINMIKTKLNVNWYYWVCQNLRMPECVSDSAPYVIADVLDVCQTRHELAIALWAALDLVTLMSVEAVERELDDAIEEVVGDAEG